MENQRKKASNPLIERLLMTFINNSICCAHGSDQTRFFSPFHTSDDQNGIEWSVGGQNTGHLDFLKLPWLFSPILFQVCSSIGGNLNQHEHNFASCLLRAAPAYRPFWAHGFAKSSYNHAGAFRVGKEEGIKNEKNREKCLAQDQCQEPPVFWREQWVTFPGRWCGEESGQMTVPG